MVRKSKVESMSGSGIKEAGERQSRTERKRGSVDVVEGESERESEITRERK